MLKGDGGIDYLLGIAPTGLSVSVLVTVCVCVVSCVLKGDGGIDYLLGIAPTGLVVYRNKTKIVSHFW